MHGTCPEKYTTIFKTNLNVKEKVNHSLYMAGVAQRVPGS